MSTETLIRAESLLRRRILVHNLIQFGCTALLIPASIWAWRFSYSLPHDYCASLLRDWCNTEPEPASTLVAVAFIVFLVVEGVRRGLEQWKSDSLDLSDIDDAANEYRTSAGSARVHFQAQYMVYLLLFAPICVLKAIQCCRSIVRAAPKTVAQASAVLARLASDRRWIPVAQLGNSSRALRLLQRMHVIWIEIQAGEWSARIALDKAELQ